MRAGRVRRRDQGADPVERPLRVRQSARRHVRPRRVSRLRACRPRLRVERQVGRAPRGARGRDRVRPARARRPRAGRAAPRRVAARRHARVRLGGVSLHRLRADVEHERLDHAGDPRVGLLARLVARRPGRRLRARGVDEVRRADRRTALAHLPLAPASVAAPGLRGGVRRWRARSPSRSSSSTRRSPVRRERSGTGRSGSSSTATRRSRSGTGGSTTPRGSPTSPRCRPSCRSASSSSPAWRRPCRGDKHPLELAALTAALLLAFELALTHWSYLYLPWVLPFVLLALFLPRTRPAAEP